MTRPALILAGCLAASGLAAVPASPAAAGGAPEPGVALPWRYETTLRYFDLAGASPGYLMHTRSQYDEDSAETYSVVRVSDGATVSTFQRSRSTPSNEDPQLVDRAYVELTPKPSTSYNPDHLDIHDLVTGTDTTVDLSAHSGYLHGDDEWALVSDAGAGTGERALSFVWADGRTVPVPTLVAGTDAAWVGGDTTTAYVTSNGHSYALDPQTGTATRLTLPDGSDLRLWAVTADTLIGRTDAYVNGQSGDRFTTVSRSTGAVTGQADVVRDYKTRYYLPYDGRVAAVYLPDSGVTTLPEGTILYRFDLRPVDMATGALQDPVATDLVDADPMGNGQVALTVGDVPTGRLAVVPDGAGAVQPVADLPRIGYGSMDVGLSDGTAVTSFEGQNGLWTTPADGTGAWQPTYPDSTPEDNRRGDFVVGGDTVLTQLPDTRSWDPHHYRLAWPGGHRDLDATGWPRLGSDGRYVVRGVPGSPPEAELQDVRTGAVVTSWADNAPRHLDGSWLWTGPAADGTMTGVDLTGQQPDRTAQVPATCSGKVPDIGEVRGRWALARCKGETLIDLWGVLPPWDLPDATSYVGLGDGFVAWVVVTPDPGCCHSDIRLRVADFSADHAIHDYGPLRGQIYPPGPDFAVDTADNPDLVYVDPSYRVRHVHLDWLGQAPLVRPDATAPALTQAPTLTPAVRSTTPVTVAPSWSYAEPDVPHEPQSGLGSYDVRYRAYPAGTSWTEPAGWSALPSAAVRVTLQPGQGRCFESRARDRDGNTSAWSAPVCSYVDDAAPTLAKAAGSPRFVPEVLSPVTFRFRASDDYAVASYDVAVRSAARGEPLGGWRTRWPATRRTSVSVSARPGTEHCFRFRARDVAGNLSAWSPARCSVLPVDDSELTTRGSVASGNLDIAIVGTYTDLQGRGASATLRGQTGRTVGLWVVKGPYEGPVDVYGGGRYLGRVSLHARWQRRAVVAVGSPRRWTGPVRVVAASGRSARLDAIAVLR